MRAALNSLAVAAPEWLRQVAQPEWYDRYDRRIEEYHFPKKKAERNKLVKTIAQDGMDLLSAVLSDDSPSWLREIPAVITLWQTWIHQFYVIDGQLRLRDGKDMPPSSLRANSSYDTQAHYSRRRGIQWHGYKVHVTETCDDDTPHLITHVETTDSTQQDNDTTPQVHEALDKKGQLPEKHLVDAGYVDAGLIVTSKTDYQVELIGPARPDVSWQAQQEGAYSIDCFDID